MQDFEGSGHDAKGSDQPVPPHPSPVGQDQEQPKPKERSKSFEPEGWQPGKH